MNGKETAKVMRPFGHEENHSVLMVIYVFVADSVQVMSSYCDVVVIRHPQPGAVQVSHPCRSVGQSDTGRQAGSQSVSQEGKKQVTKRVRRMDGK